MADKDAHNSAHDNDNEDDDDEVDVDQPVDANAAAGAPAAQKKKKKKKKKSKPAGDSATTASQPPNATQAPAPSQPADASKAAVSAPATQDQAVVQEQLLKILKKLEIQARKANTTHEFWSKQPVLQEPLPDEENGPIEPDQPIEKVRAEPYPLPEGFQWVLVSIDDPKESDELYELLHLNYVEDTDALFRFDYSKDFLQWALKPPGWRTDWHIGIRVTASNKLVAFISAIPTEVQVYDKTKHMVEINFLCAHKKLRSKRLAPVLIKEITRRVNLTGIFQAAYTAGVALPTPIGKCRYYHRSLNPQKLVETGFSALSKNETLPKLIKRLEVPASPLLPGFRAMEERDLEAVQATLNTRLQKFKLTQRFSLEEARHWLLPRDKVIYSYVVEDAATNQITDFVSFYALPSTVINSKEHSHVNAAYAFYYFAKEGNLVNLFKDALVAAKNNGFDVFNALGLMDNMSFIKELEFGPGDGFLHYYLFNWKCRSMADEEIGLVLL